MLEKEKKFYALLNELKNTHKRKLLKERMSNNEKSNSNYT